VTARRARAVARWSALASIALVGACIGASVPTYRPTFVRDVDTDGDKVVQVVSNERLPDHEARPVSQAFVFSAMLASGFFDADDARNMAAFMADELGAMDPREQLRIVAWAHDAPLVYYVFIHEGKLRFAYYRRGDELERHDAIIPAEAVAMSAAVAPSSDGGPVAAPSAPPGAVVASTAPSAAPATAAPAPASPPRARRRKATAQPPPISEDEARRKLNELDAALREGTVSPSEHKKNRKAILARL
jgi:hypothetical protein